MERCTISDAIDILDELLETLTEAYWDANETHHKDVIFDAYTTANNERGELSKLGVEDFQLRYEPVTAQFLSSPAKFKELQNNTDRWFPRTKTAENLRNALQRVLTLVSAKRF